jgi:hypothetical protein
MLINTAFLCKNFSVVFKLFDMMFMLFIPSSLFL